LGRAQIAIRGIWIPVSIRNDGAARRQFTPLRHPRSVLSGGLRRIGFRHDESGRACNILSDNTKRLTTSNENGKSAFVFLQRNIGNPTS